MRILDRIIATELTPKGRKIPKPGDIWEVKRGKKNSGTDVKVVEVAEVVDMLWVYYKRVNIPTSQIKLTGLPLGKFTSHYQRVK